MAYYFIRGGYYLIFRNLINFPVSLFFFIAGYFCSITGTIGQYYKKRLIKLVIPYLIWSVLYFILYASVNGQIRSPLYYLYALATGGAATPLYYIVALLFMTILSPWLIKATDSKGASWCIMGVTIFFQAIGYISMFYGLSIWKYLKLTPIWIAFYYGGMYMKKQKIVLSRKHIPILILGVLVSVGLEIGETILELSYENFKSIAFSQYRLTGFLYAGIICLLVYTLACNKVERSALSYIGDNSYGIFYTHYIFIIIIRFLLGEELLNNIPLPFVHILEFGFAIIGSILLISILKKVLSKRLYLLIGL